MEPLRIFEKFQLDQLDKSWVKSMWDQEFLFYDEKIPGDFLLFIKSEDMEVLLKETCTTVKSWIDLNKNIEPNERSEVSWQTLCALSVDQKALLALLGFIIKSGQSLDADEDSRQACLLATSLYLTLLAIPGSSAYQIFHENLYETVIRSLELSKHLMPVTKKPVKSQDYESLYLREEESSTLLQTERITLTHGLNTIIYNMILMLDSWSMRDYVRSLELTVHLLIEVTKLGTDILDFKSQMHHSERSVNSLVYNSYVALRKLCNPRHGHVDVTIKLIARYILPHMLYNYVSISSKSLNILRDTSINFLKTLLTTHQKNAEQGIIILIQHLMINCPERLDARQKQASVIAKLINICPRSLYIKTIKNVVLYSYNNKIVCRVFSQEIIAKLLESPNDFLEQNQISDDILSDMNIKRILLATVLSRCTDVSPMVRGRAMQTLADYTDDSQNALVVDLFKESNDIDILPSLEDIQNAFDKDINLFPNRDTLIGMLRTRVEDDRAVLRTRAIHILRNGVLMVPDLLESVSEIISNHCRDPVMIVRRFSIQVLTMLLGAFSNDSNLYKTWVKAVMPQIFDVENRVQEKVMESMESMIIDRISNSTTKDDDLPWKILNELTQRKMRKHLTRACDSWVKNDIITDSLILKIQSHIHSKNNIPAWVLLSAIVENKTLPSMKEYFEDYESLFRGKGFFEYLALEVLRCCWSTFDNKFLQKLSEDLLQLFQKSLINPELISISLDILYDILKNLNPSEPKKIEKSMHDLIRQSEKVIERIILDVEHTQEDITNYLKAICTLGHASFLCTSNIKLPVLRILQGMLIDWEMMPSSLKNVRELQALTVVALGQQAMREQTIAYEMTPIFGQLLSAGVDSSNVEADAAVRVNAAKALADVCMRFTALVEPHLPDMCICMKGENTAVREAIVVIFIQLLVEDFIKVKGIFFFHILTMLSDSDETIREMTVFLIRERLLMKNKTLISQQFLESLFHYNNYEIDKKYYDRKMRKEEMEALTLPGQINQAKRRMIYDFMLEHLDPPGKLKILVGLTNQILNGIAGGRIKVNEEKGQCILRDTLYIIGSDYLQPSSCGNKHNDDDMEESTNNVTVSHAANVIVEGIKKHYYQVLLPNLMRLKKTLAEQSNLVEEVRKLIIKVGSELSKDQLSSLYNEHPEIENELENDLRKLHKKSQLYTNEEQGGEEENSGGNEDESQKTEGEKNTLISEPSTPQAHPLLDSDRIPRIILHKLPLQWENISSPLSSIDIPIHSNQSITSSGNNCKISSKQTNENSS
ncbi:condensin-2 complex subunit D3-like [Chelonus insularis]|uniref:condensin-2 complex subunit D3-like n=1 Tax=Chelonus insularis TaxID=460826 RepID=UPI00158B5333|nr:condensin-2 complex subunit D3-like [Chelonus insularis]